MPPELAALIEKPALLIAILFLGGLIGMQVERFATNERPSGGGAMVIGSVARDGIISAPCHPDAPIDALAGW